MGIFSKLFGNGETSDEVKKNEVNAVSDETKREIRERFLNDFFGVNLKDSPNRDWTYIDSETNMSGDIVRTYKKQISSPYFDFCEAKVIGNSATNFFFEADYSREKAFDVIFLIERDMLRGGKYNNVECIRKYRDDILNEMCSLEWSIDGLDIRFCREDEGYTMSLGIWTKYYNEALDGKKEEKIQNKTSPKAEWHDDIRLYYYDADGNECEKLIRDGEMWTTITGIRFRKNPEEIMASIYEGATVVLKPEPDNPVDPYAVAIYFKNELIGYVPKKDVPAILTCISPSGTDARIDKIEPKFIRVILAGTMKYINSHECLSRFRIVIEKDEDESPISSVYDDVEENSIKAISEEISDEDENSEQKYVMKEITEMLPATCDTLEVVRDNIERMMEGDAPIFMGVIQDDVPMYINPIHKEVLYIKNAEMEECLRKGYTVGFTISGITNTDNLAVEIGVKLQVLLERAYYDNKIAELEEEMAVIEKAKNILEEGIEKTTDGHIHHEEQFEIEGDDEFDEDEMAEWESHSLHMPFTYESEKQFEDILHYLLAGNFMCFKGNKELGEGVYYCKKYDAYLRFRDSLIDEHIRNGNKVAFFIRNLDMTDRPKDIELTVALNLY